jgi:hypothetical protein
MTQKNILTCTTVAAVALSASSAFGFAEIARGKLVANAQFQAVYDTNIFANSSEEDDISGVFTPSLSYTRSVGRIASAINTGVRAISFEKTGGQDSLDPYVNGSFTYDRAEKGGDSLTVSYARSTEANDIVNDRTESDEYRGSWKTDYFYTEKTGLRVNGGYRVSHYNTAGYNNVSSYDLGGGVVYRYSPKLLASATYNFSPEKATNLGAALNDPSSQNHRFRLGLEGEIAPKVNGSVGVGYVYRDFDDGRPFDDTILADVVITWTASAKTGVTWTASNNFDTTPGAESAKNFVTSLALNQSLTEKISATANVGYQNNVFDRQIGVRRTDDAYNAGLSLNYRINDIVSSSASVTHRISESTLAVAEYDRTVVSLSVNLTY